MSGETGEDVGAVTSNTPDNANVLCRVGKRDKIFTDFDGRDSLPILNKFFLSRWTKNKKFCLFRYQGNIVPLTVLECEDEQVLKAEDVIGNQGTVIRLAYTGDGGAGGTKIHTELGQLGDTELVVVGQLVELVTVHATLLNAKPIQDGAHEGFGPLPEGESVAKPVIEVDQSMVTGSCFVGLDRA